MDQDTTSADAPPAQPVHEPSNRPFILFGCLMMLLPFCGIFIGALSDPYRRTPSPEHLKLQIETPPSRMACFPIITRVADHPEQFAFHEKLSHEDTWINKTYQYPSGRLLHETRSSTPPAELPAAAFDFNADGIADQADNIHIGYDEYITVFSGSGPEKLYSQFDHGAVGGWSTCFPLGDLDNDGFSELAIYHRRNGADYDNLLRDMLWPCRSWISIVSLGP